MDIEATVTSPTDKELKLSDKWLLVWLQATGYLLECGGAMSGLLRP